MAFIYTSVYKWGNKLMARGFDDETGERINRQVDFKPYLYVKSNNPDKVVARGLRSEPLERIDFDDIRSMEDFYEQYKDVDGFKIFGCRDVVFQYLSEGWKGKINFDFKFIRGSIVDIEVESGSYDPQTGEVTKGPFPEPSEANYPINACTIYDSKTKCFYVLGLESFQGVKVGVFDSAKLLDSIKGCKIVYRGFEREGDLLEMILKLFEMIQPDFLSGWNSETFDIPYICTRIGKVLGEDQVKRLSPWRNVRKRTFNGSFGREEVTYEIKGVADLDYKSVIEKHGYVELPNRKLQTAAEHFIGEGKIEYEGSLSDLYFKDYQRFICYNIHDVNLIVKMDAKLKFFNLMYTIAYKAHANAEDALATIQPWTALVYERLHNRGEEPELKPLFDGDVEYPGAYVKEPVPGIYDWPVSIDAESLYPNMVKQYNMGTETILTEHEAHVMRMLMIKELDEAPMTAYTIKLRQHLYSNTSISDFYWEEPFAFKVLKEHEVCMAPNLSFYSTKRQSVFAEIFTEMGIERKVVKKDMLKAQQQVVDLKEAKAPQAEIDAAEAAVASLNNLQQAIKILQNAAYGALANRYFREYYNVKIAEAITLGGQNSTQFIMHKINQFFSELTGVKREYSLYGDTDSVYISIPEWVRQNFTAQQEADVLPVVEGIDRLISKELEPKLVQWATEMAFGLGCKQNNLIFKREAIAVKGIWVAKKKYAMMVSNNEGVQYPKPKLKFTGLEAKKSNYPKICQEAMKTVYELAMMGNEKQVHEFVKEFKGKYMAQPLNSIAAPTGIGEIAKHLDEFGHYKKGAPGHVKAAILHNYLIKERGLSIKPISEDDKILRLPLKPINIGGMPYDSIAYQDNLPKEFGLHDRIDKSSLFAKTFLDPINIYLKAIKWSDSPKASIMDFFA